MVAREHDLQAALNRQEDNAQDAGDSDVQDEIDRVTTSAAKSAALDIGAREFQSLRDVRDALARLDTGDYGRCTICGKEIEPARLAAIPETPFCLEHADTGRAAAAGSATMMTS